jgi:GT2 family glycosyltransferase
LATTEGRRVSVLIPTKDRPADLVLSVRSLLAQSILPGELLIADQSGNDYGRAQVEKEFAEASEVVKNGVKLLHLIEPKISGAAEARNRLMNLASGDIWLFLDDDVSLEHNCIEKLLSVYLECLEVVGVAGIITNYAKPALIERLWASAFARGPFRDERQPIYWKASSLVDSQPIRVTKFTGACMSFKADAIGTLRFDHKLTGGSLAEDIDFCARLVPRRLVIAPRARLVHRRSASNRSRDHWLREHAQSAYYMYRRNWNRKLSGKLSFVWLRLGYYVIVPAGCVRRWSLEPWQAFRQGVRSAIALTN